MASLRVKSESVSPWSPTRCGLRLRGIVCASDIAARTYDTPRQCDRARLRPLTLFAVAALATCLVDRVGEDVARDLPVVTVRLRGDRPDLLRLDEADLR